MDLDQNVSMAEVNVSNWGREFSTPCLQGIHEALVNLATAKPIAFQPSLLDIKLQD